ncbi:hypothetical protein [Chitinophaga sp. S165]|uniref:hypothetical protein n=1 Tax=Chitinophaga sp. S165 TaxID=2135462 RepID=UPI000D93EA7F|nr:hypothetical protein [Chitinophaga sp. S165]PWV51941.1 hypothetical protein C7475_103551 [Chitinophaga sp. S165]
MWNIGVRLTGLTWNNSHWLSAILIVTGFGLAKVNKVSSYLLRGMQKKSGSDL